MAGRAWSTTDEIARALVEGGHIAAAAQDAVILDLLKRELRQFLRTERDERGRNAYHHVTVTDELGNDRDIYKQYSFFALEDYQFTVSAHARIVRRHLRTIEELIADCEARFGVQLPLPFELPIPAGS